VLDSESLGNSVTVVKSVVRILSNLLCSMAIFSGFGVASAEEEAQWLTYSGGDGPGKGKRIVLIAADQEYRSEQSMPMMAKILSKHHGFDCTVLFAVNEKGEVDPTMPVYPEKGQTLKEHHIPGLEQLASADMVIFFPRLLTLPMVERELIVKYIDSGKPFMSIRTGNHGFQGEASGVVDAEWGRQLARIAHGAASRVGFPGVTLDQYGAPLAGVTVILHRTATREYVMEIVSDANGNYLAQSVYAGEGHYKVIHKAGAINVFGASDNNLIGA
jgi:hypothetical protein